MSTSNQSSGGKSNSQNFELSVLERYEPVIGLEVHCQLNTHSKLFCSCSTKFGALPNAFTCPICLGYPGVLPVLNQRAVEYAIRLSLAIGAKINETSEFSRKQYFYPDLPKGYQISQYDRPYSNGGKIVLDSGLEIRIERVHIEEDAGKNVHGEGSSYVDLNRAGIPLVEIVSCPDIRNPSDAAEYLKKLRSLVRYLEICDGNLEEGSFRCDANVSIRKRGTEKFGTRCEIKNLNSFRNIEKAISYEILRQADVLDHGGQIIQQTMLYDAASGKTSPMRSKEQSHDYRYFPEPDLKLLRITDHLIEKVKKELPELPEQMANRFCEQYELPSYDAKVLTAEKELAVFYENLVKELKNKNISTKIIANWVHSEYLREVNLRSWDLVNPPIGISHMSELLGLLADQVISGRIAKVVFEEMVEHGGTPKEIVEKKSLVQVSDTGAIESVIQQVIRENSTQLKEYLSGKEKLYGFFVGQAMKLSGGKLNPGILNEALKKELEKLKQNVG